MTNQDESPHLDAPGAGSKPEDTSLLRRRAENTLRGGVAPSTEDLAALSRDALREALHELRVHQVELEMQNEELRRAQLEVDRARERYFDLYDLAPVGYCTVSEGGVIIEANLTAATLLGTAPGGLVRQAFSRFISSDDQDCYYLHRQQLLATRRSRVFDLTMVRHDGTPLRAQVAATVAEGDDGTPELRLVLGDFSELHALSEELAHTREQLQQAEKMAAIGQLAAGVAHEINNPVGYVNSNFGMLSEYLTSLLQVVGVYYRACSSSPPDESLLLEANRLAGEIDLDYIGSDAIALVTESKEGMERIRRIVRGLKDFAGAESDVWETVDIHACLENTLKVLRAELKDKVTLIRDYGDLPPITGLPQQLVQVFLNLLVNAAHAIIERGTINLRTGRREDSVWIEVQDSGGGIAPEDLARVFEPFFTTKPVGSGSGLGMAVAYGIIQKHGGRIAVRSEVGQGTTFRISLPIQPRGVDRQATTKGSQLSSGM